MTPPRGKSSLGTLISALRGRARGWLDRHQERKRIVRNTLWLYIDQNSRLIIALFVGVWVARYLGPPQWGTLNYALALIGLLMPLADFGLDTLVLRELSERPENDLAILGTAFWIRVASTLACLGALVAWSLSRGPSASEAIVLVTSLMLFSSPWDAFDLWFQAKRRSRESVLGRAPALWTAAAYRVALILMHAPLIAFAAAPVLDVLLGAAGGAWMFKRARGVLPFVFDAAELKVLLKECVPLILTGLSVMIYMKIDVVMLQSISGAEATGIYSAATRVSEIWYFIPVAFVGSAAPSLFASRRHDLGQFFVRFQRTMDFSAGIGYAFAAGISLAAPLIIRVLYGQRFMAAAPMLSVLAWAGLFVCLGLVQGNWWNVERLNGARLLATASGALVNVALNFLWLPHWGGLGAAWATLIAQGCSVTVFPALWPRSRRVVWIQLKALAAPLRLPSLLKEAAGVMKER